MFFHLNLLGHILLLNGNFLPWLIQILIDLQVRFHNHDLSIFSLIVLINIVNQVEIELILNRRNLNLLGSPFGHEDIVLPIHIGMQVHVQVFHFTTVDRVLRFLKLPYFVLLYLDFDSPKFLVILFAQIAPMSDHFYCLFLAF